MLWYKKSFPDWNEGHCHSLCQHYFFDSRKKDAKNNGSNLNYKLDKKKRWYLCGRCSTLGRMPLFWEGRSCWMLWYKKSSRLKRRHCHSLCQHYFFDSRKKDAKYNGSNLNYKLDKKKKKKTMVFVWQVQHFGMHAALLCGRRWALEVWWLCCVALPCNSHATHTQHTVNTTRNTSTFPVNSQSKVRVVCQNLTFAFKDRILGQPLEIRTFIENLQEKCPCCVLCWLCVACVLHVSCMAGPRNTTIILPKPSACHTKERHASQSAAPATQIPSFFSSNL